MNRKNIDKRISEALAIIPPGSLDLAYNGVYGLRGGLNSCLLLLLPSRGWHREAMIAVASQVF